jgi:hypothetical protein
MSTAAAKKVRGSCPTETKMVMAMKPCNRQLCGSIWRNITVFVRSQRRVLGTPIRCYMCGSAMARGKQKDRLWSWR